MGRRDVEDVVRTRAFWLAYKPGETSAPQFVAEPPVWWHVALALGAALTVQSTLAPILAFRGATPSFVLLVVAWYGVRTGTLRGLTFGLIAGACEDALSGTTGAAWTFATALAGLLFGRLARTWLADTQLVIVPGVALVTLVRYGAVALILQLEGRPLAMALEHLPAVLWQALLDALVAFAAVRFRPELLHAHRR